MTAWIDYLIASDDPADQALMDEHRARSWAYAQTMQWIVGQDGIKPEAFDKLQQENDLANELQARIHARGVALKASGAPAASDEHVAACNATWVPLVSNLIDERIAQH